MIIFANENKRKTMTEIVGYHGTSTSNANAIIN